jgi:DNA helicase-2/ATP-dependent DNA helicase PcrA
MSKTIRSCCICQLKSTAGSSTRQGKGYVRYEHMVIDEVQDLSVHRGQAADRLRLVGGRCQRSCQAAPGRASQSLTMAGDVAQRLIFDNGFSRWEELLQAVGLRHVHIQKLHIMYRSTAEVMGLAQSRAGTAAYR